MKLITKQVGPFGVNSYIVYDKNQGRAAIIDPGGDGEKLLEEIVARNLEVKYILLTHGHFDHIGAVGWLKEKTGAKIAIHKEDAAALTDIFKNLSFTAGIESVQPEADILLEHGDSLTIGEIELKVSHTPGHSLGSICFLGDGIVFSGDTLFSHSIGRTDLLGGSMDEILGSIKRELLVLGDETLVYPGHGPSTTIGDEKKANPYLKGLV